MSPMEQTTIKTNIPTEQIDPALLARAKQFLAIRSSIDHPDEVRSALDFITDMLAAHPEITVEHFEHNGIPSILAYHGPKRPERFKVLLNGHVDVVPANGSQFQPRITGDRLYARGALDMKFMTLLMTEAFIQLAPLVDYPLGLQITTDEETGGYDGIYHQITQGVKTDMAIAGERTSLNVTTALKGICWLRITQEGKHAHGSRPWEGENAVTKLTHLAEKLQATYPSPDEPSWTTTANVAWIRTDNSTHNRIPDAAEMGLDIRFIASDPHFASKESVRTFFAELDPTAQVHFVLHEPAISAETSNPYVTCLLNAMIETRGEVETIRRYASADIRFYGNDPNTTCVEFGLTGEGDHGDEEYVELSSIPMMQKALHTFLHNVAAVENN